MTISCVVELCIKIGSFARFKMAPFAEPVQSVSSLFSFQNFIVNFIYIIFAPLRSLLCFWLKHKMSKYVKISKVELQNKSLLISNQQERINCGLYESSTYTYSRTVSIITKIQKRMITVLRFSHKNGSKNGIEWSVLNFKESISCNTITILIFVCLDKH